MTSEVLVGDKELGRYYTAVEKQLEDSEHVSLLSRGQVNNGKALDVAEIIRREGEAAVEHVSTSTATFENDDGEEVSVTELEIEIERKEE
jgi:DNA-binding protein Alba